jgi:hypothetical protein
MPFSSWNPIPAPTLLGVGEIFSDSVRIRGFLDISDHGIALVFVLTLILSIVANNNSPEKVLDPSMRRRDRRTFSTRASLGAYEISALS